MTASMRREPVFLSRDGKPYKYPTSAWRFALRRAGLGTLPYIWLVIDDEPGPDSLRGYIERNAIALLSNCGKAPLDPPSPGWLGRSSTRGRVRESGLWNNEHVADGLDPRFLDRLVSIIVARP